MKLERFFRSDLSREILKQWNKDVAYSLSKRDNEINVKKSNRKCVGHFTPSSRTTRSIANGTRISFLYDISWTNFSALGYDETVVNTGPQRRRIRTIGKELHNLVR